MDRELIFRFRRFALVLSFVAMFMFIGSAARAGGFSEFRSVGALAAYLGAPLPNASGGNPWRANCGESAQLTLASAPTSQQAKVIARIGSRLTITEETNVTNTPELIRWMAQQRERKFNDNEPLEQQWGISRSRISGSSSEIVDYPDYSAALMEVIGNLRFYTKRIEECRAARRTNSEACTYRVGATDPLLEVRQNSWFNGSLRWQSSRIIPGDRGRKVDQMPRYREQVRLALEILRTQFQIQVVDFNAEGDGALAKVELLERILFEAEPSRKTTRYNPFVRVRPDGSLGFSP